MKHTKTKKTDEQAGFTLFLFSFCRWMKHLWKITVVILEKHTLNWLIFSLVNTFATRVVIVKGGHPCVILTRTEYF